MNKIKRIALAAALAGLLFPAARVLAEDTDIYAANTDAIVKPNVLIVIDNSANWAANDQGWPDTLPTYNTATPPVMTDEGCPGVDSTGGCKQGRAELRALRAIASELTLNTNVGMMMFSPSTGGLSNASGENHDGGYVRWHMRPMTATNRTNFRSMIGTSYCSDSTNSNGSPNCIYKNFSSGSRNESTNTASTDYSATMFEAFKYFGGYTSPAHADDDVAGSPVDASHFGTLRYATLDPRYDRSAYTASPDLLNLVTPLTSANACAKNYIIFIGNGYPTQDSPASLLTGVGGDATQTLAPDFVTSSGVVSETQLGDPATFADEAACRAAALATYADSYSEYRCVSSTTTTDFTLGTSGCGDYASATACASAAATAYPGYSTYSCTTAGSCSGTYSLGASACYASEADCTSAAASLFPSHTAVSCGGAPTPCTATTDVLNSGTGAFAAGNYATQSACEAAAATMTWPKTYNSFICTAGAGVSTALGSSSCYASQAGCAAGEAAKYPAYSAVSCGATGTACTAVRVDVCGGASAYNTDANCNSGAPGALGAAYASYSCVSSSSKPANWTGPASCSGSNKYWIITGTNNSYAVTGTGTPWTVTGTINGGDSYAITGTGGNAYTMTASNTQTLWTTYGRKVVNTSLPTGTFTSSSANYADEWAQFLQQTDVSAAVGQQNVTTYTIDVFKDHQDQDQTRLLMNMARLGGGKYFTATDENSIKNALRNILAEIQSVNSVFASSSLPVSVNTQGKYLNQVFMGMFRPSSGSRPRWVGNLKQYEFAYVNGVLKLADKYGSTAINPTTGFIDPCATSFWSTATMAYWNYSGTSGKGGCRIPSAETGTVLLYSDAPDGDVVEKGGVAQKLRGTKRSGTSLVLSTNYATRNLKTCDGTSATSCTEFTDFNSANPLLNAAAFGITSAPATYQSTFIDWVRGKDVDDERPNTNLNEVRPSVHGGVVHSQPAVVDYGGTTGVVGFYGSDDGVFHAVDANQGDLKGTELWGFIAPEHYRILNRLRDNGSTTPLVDFPGVAGTVAPKEYAFDGSLGVYQKASTSTVWIFPTQRRGGRAIYAFDVSTPGSPSIKWRKGCFTSSTSDDSMCTAGWSGIGQTWSTPIVSYINGYSGPVLIFGGGYDTCEDTNSQTRCTTTPRKGANIWFVDAATGNIIRIYPTHYSVTGDITAMTDITSGNVTHVYATDTGGNVYRINVGTWDGTSIGGSWSTNSAASSIQIGSFSETGQARKFIYGPTVVQLYGFNIVLMGSGDREHPLMSDYACMNGTGGVQNQFYMLTDRPDAYPATPAHAGDLVDISGSSATFDKGTGTFTNSAGATSTLGWKFNLPNSCEQAVNKTFVTTGYANFGTNAPVTSATACETDLGVSWGYKVNFLTGEATSAAYVGGGMPPSPVGGIVEVDGQAVPFCIGCINPDDTLQFQLGGSELNIPDFGTRYRTYWYIETD